MIITKYLQKFSFQFKQIMSFCMLYSHVRAQNTLNRTYVATVTNGHIFISELVKCLLQ